MIKKITYKPIGVVHTPFARPKDVPIQSKVGRGIKGWVEVFPQYVEGLKDVEGFSHLILVVHFHLSRKTSLIAQPYLDDTQHGIFAIRGPSRPNSIGISIVRLIERKDNALRIGDIDLVDGTPLLDIKPYVPQFDERSDVKIGWLAEYIHKLRN